MQDEQAIRRALVGVLLDADIGAEQPGARSLIADVLVWVLDENTDAWSQYLLDRLAKHDHKMPCKKCEGTGVAGDCYRCGGTGDVGTREVCGACRGRTQYCATCKGMGEVTATVEMLVKGVGV